MRRQFPLAEPVGRGMHQRQSQSNDDDEGITAGSVESETQDAARVVANQIAIAIVIISPEIRSLC